MPSALKLPPGLQLYTLKNLARTLAPLAIVVALARAAHSFAGVAIPWPLVATIALLSVPGTYAAGITYRGWTKPRRAARAGAVLPPRWDGKRFGNLDILSYGIDRYHHGYIGDGFWDRIDELGHLHEVTVLWAPVYLTTDASVVKTVLSTAFEDFEKGADFRDTMHSVLGTGVFNSDGDMWKFHRTMTRPYFSRDRISHFELFDRHADLAIQKMKDRFRSGRPLDFQDLISRFTLDSATEFLFGSCVNSLHSELPYAHNEYDAATLNARRGGAVEAFASAFMDAQYLIGIRARLGWMWRFKELTKDLSAGYMEVVDSYIEPILERVIAKNQEKGKTAEKTIEADNETLLDHLVKQTDDPVVLHDETLNILIAGRDTTAATLTFAVYLLCLYPEVFKRLRAEVMDKIGPTQMPTFDDIRSMKYLRAVINETLRLYPAVPFNVRVSNCDTTVPNPDPTKPPIFVPKDVTISYSVFLMHRRKDYWGPDALEFDPDRFLDERLNKYFTANPFIFLPFNAGPRICLGQQFAYNEMSFFLIRLLQNFSHMEMDLAARPPDACPPAEWASAEGHKGREQIIARTHLTMYVHGGLWVKMAEADSHDA